MLVIYLYTGLILWQHIRYLLANSVLKWSFDLHINLDDGGKKTKLKEKEKASEGFPTK